LMQPSALSISSPQSDPSDGVASNVKPPPRSLKGEFGDPSKDGDADFVKFVINDSASYGLLNSKTVAFLEIGVLAQHSSHFDQLLKARNCEKDRTLQEYSDLQINHTVAQQVLDGMEMFQQPVVSLNEQYSSLLKIKHHAYLKFKQAYPGIQPSSALGLDFSCDPLLVEMLLSHLKHGTLLGDEYILELRLLAWMADIDGFTVEPKITELNCMDVIAFSILPMLFSGEEAHPWHGFY